MTNQTPPICANILSELTKTSVGYQESAKSKSLSKLFLRNKINNPPTSADNLIPNEWLEAGFGCFWFTFRLVHGCAVHDEIMAAKHYLRIGYLRDQHASRITARTVT